MKNKRVWLILAVILLVVALVLFLVLRNREDGGMVTSEDTWSDPVLDTEGYEAVFATMDGEFYFSEQEFLDYRGLKVVKPSARLEKLEHIWRLTELVSEKSESVHTVYLQINPMQLYKNLEDGMQWQETLETYMATPIQESEGVTFEILLSYPQLSYLAELTDAEWNEFKQVYFSFVESLSGLENVFVYYLGDKEWLNRNPLNYETDFMVNQMVEKSILLSTFCDRKYTVTPAEMQILFAELEELFGFYRARKYPDLSEWSFVFLGDSIIGNDRSTCSVPSVVSAFSGARTYNCAKNGAAATYDREAEVSFLDVTEAIISGDVESIVNVELADGIKAFKEEYAGGKLCFVLNYGLNDYFVGYPTEDKANTYNRETYAGALRTGIGQLKQAYPDALIIVMLPTYTVLYEEGTQIMGDAGAQLTEYRRMACSVAEEMGVLWKDNFTDIPLDIHTHTTILADGTHLNEMGRYVLGTQIIIYFEKEVLNISDK